jgi:hypothetical protein
MTLREGLGGVSPMLGNVAVPENKKKVRKMGSEKSLFFIFLTPSF